MIETNSNNSRKTQIAQQRFIEAARELLKPSPVRLNHIPGWMLRAMQLARREGRISVGGDGASRSWPLLQAAERAATNDGMSPALLYHWGSSTSNKGLKLFVTEPYYLNLNAAESFARILDLKWYYSANSFWFPGQTFRIAFWQDLTV